MENLKVELGVRSIISGKIILNDDCSNAVYLGSWESISAWWLNSLEIDCVVSAFHVDETQPDTEALRFLLDSIKDGENKRRVKRTSSELSSVLQIKAKRKQLNEYETKKNIDKA